MLENVLGSLAFHPNFIFPLGEPHCRSGISDLTSLLLVSVGVTGEDLSFGAHVG